MGQLDMFWSFKVVFACFFSSDRLCKYKLSCFDQRSVHATSKLIAPQTDVYIYIYEYNEHKTKKIVLNVFNYRILMSPYNPHLKYRGIISIPFIKYAHMVLVHPWMEYKKLPKVSKMGRNQKSRGHQIKIYITKTCM